MIYRETQYAYVHYARFQLPAMLAAFALLAATTLVATQASAAPAPKVDVCHIPPANPANFHTIRVSEKALSKHLAHGDVAGPCNDVCAVLCDDGNACTIDDTGDCENNGCPTTPEAVDCNDSNACTADSCEPTTGCVYTALTGTTCTVENPGTCEEGTGICDSAGACDPDDTAGCCLSTAECEAWDTDLCTNEECIETACVTTSTVVCETDACHISVCTPSDGTCTTPEPVVCEELECHDNGCDPITGCFSDPIDECCISDSECDDGNNCTTDTCFGIYGCVSTECASGDSCNVLVECDEFTCEPTTVPQECNDDGDLCTVESCVEGLGCVSDPVECPDDGNPCTVEGCSNGACISAPVECPDDGNLCTAESCEGGACVSTSVDCPFGAACDPATGECVSLCHPAPEGLAAWWTFDADGTDIQSGLNGTLLNGATAGATGVVGGALSLDGTDDYVEVPDSAALTTPGGITIDAWVKPTTLAAGNIVSKYNSSPTVGQFSFTIGAAFGDGRVRFCVYENPNFNCADTDAPVLNPGVWQHVAGTFDVATQEAKVYVDGVEVPSSPPAGSSFISAIDDTDIPVLIGTIITSGGAPVGHWPGLIDELEIFDRALSPAEVAGIYNAGAEGKCRDNLPDPPCFSIIPEFGAGGGTSAVDMCIYECDARGQCPTSPADICNLKDDPGFLEVVEACLSGASFNACVQVDAYNLENGCDNICPLPQGEADFVVCGDGGCFRHNSETGALAEVLTQQTGPGVCGDTESHVFFHPDGDLWMYNIRNPLSQGRSEICIYDGPESFEQTFDLPEPCDPSGCTFNQISQRPEFEIKDWIATNQGNVYASASGTCRGLSNTVCTGPQTYMWRIDPQSAFETPATGVDPECGARPSTMVADPFATTTERAYVVATVSAQQRLISMELGTATPGCTAVSILTDAASPTELRHEAAIARLRVDSSGAVYFLARLGGGSGWRDEGIWRVPAGGGEPEQVLAMCDVINPVPGGTCTTDWNFRNKPIIDFAIHPTTGHLYVVEKAPSPSQSRIQVYDVSGTSASSLGILREFDRTRKIIEFFPN